MCVDAVHERVLEVMKSAGSFVMVHGLILDGMGGRLVSGTWSIVWNVVVQDELNRKVSAIIVPLKSMIECLIS